MNTKLQELKAKHERELRDLERTEAIRAELPDVFYKWNVHASELYGTIGSASIKRANGYSDQQPTDDMLARVADELPGLPMVLVRGTFTSVLAREQLPHYKHSESVKEETPLAPWYVVADYGNTMALEWVARTSLGLLRVSFELPTYSSRLRYACRTVERRGYTSYDNERIEFDTKQLYTIESENGEPVAEHLRQLKYAKGSPSSRSRILSLWQPTNENTEPKTIDFVRHLTAD